MNAIEVDGVFHCDCGFSWSRGKNGNHNCADGLRKKIQQLVADNEKAMDSLRQADAAVKLAHEKYSAISAENVAIREQSEEVYAAGYNHGHLNTVDGIAYADCVKDEFYGLALRVMAEVETPATDRIVAGIKADEEKAVLNDLLRHLDKIDIENLSSPWELSSEVVAFVNSRLLREGADK
ncbi:hypothetical protein [Klebsiella michiganensis]|uniref:hypothetical protein n=1 Tax=Klebsiella michiganensis TaxID=1134687 RepID=UPI0015A83BA3|nr:hypothetical protein [Klebsiella michiganensis]